MEKGIMVFAFASAILLCMFSLVSAQDELQQAQQGLEAATSAGQKITSSQSSSFLAEQWKQFLSDTQIGKTISAYLDIPKGLNPVFKYTLGIEFSWSAVFFTTLFLWFLIGNYFKNLIDITGIMSKYVRLILTILSTILVSLVGITSTLASWIASGVNLVSAWQFRILIWVLLFVGWIYLMSLAKKVHKLFRKTEREVEQKRNIAELKRSVEEMKSRNAGYGNFLK